MSGLVKFWRSSVGAKISMAVTGIIIVLFLIAHMVGNLLIFAGPEAMNNYAYFLQHKAKGLVWTMRIVLLLALIIHVWAAIRVTLRNRAAREVRYMHQKYTAATYASRTMIWGGIIIFAFIVYHLLHYTLGKINPQFFSLQTQQGLHDVHRMVVLNFQNPLIAGWYIFAQILLWMHLKHGISSFFQTMGWNNRKYRPLTSALGPILSAIISLGFISVPAAVLLGFVK